VKSKELITGIKKMSTDWLDELLSLREQDKAKQVAKTKSGDIDLSVLDRQKQAAITMEKCEAHKLLRRVNGVLLGGKGAIDIFDRSNEYDRAIALAWQGPISAARRPNLNDSGDFQYILIGAGGNKLFVNGRQVKQVSPEALKSALVWAAKNPMHWSGKNEK
jgi:hypothetical protein